MIPDVYNEIMENLYSKTLQGSVEWTGTVNAREFLVYFEKFALSIRDGVYSDTTDGFVIVTLKNEQGKNLDSFAIDEGDPWYRKALDLHAAARRKANKVDDALKLIATELASGGVVGKKPTTEEDEEEDVPF